MAGNQNGLSGLLGAYLGVGETFPIQGPPEPDHLKLKRLEREKADLLRRFILLLKSPELDFLTDNEFVDRFGLLAEQHGIEISSDRKCFHLLLASCLPQMKEFKRPPGRKKTEKPKDYERYRAIRKYRMENPIDEDCDDVTAIRALVEASHPLFAGRYTEETLSVSVSNGKRIFNRFAARANSIAKVAEALLSKGQTAEG